MGMNEYLNIVIALLSILTTVLAWKVYRLSKAVSILVLFLAVTWGMLFRVLIVIFAFLPPDFNATVGIGVFWVLFPIGMWGLLKSLKSYSRKERK